MKMEGIQVNQVFHASRNVSGQGSRELRKEPYGIPQAEGYTKEKIYAEEELIKAVEKANKSFVTFDRSFKISVHERLNTIMVKVIDNNNGEVIREIPPKKLLDMVANMLEVAGILVDTKG